MSAREIARDVLLEAVGSGATPFVPLPWVDDWLVARLLRRIARKVMVRRGIEPNQSLVVDLADGFVGAGAAPIAAQAAIGAVRFVVRKVAVVLDVKKSHDVFGQAIAFALALDAAIARGALRKASGREVGALLHHVVEAMGSAAVEGLAGAVRRGFEKDARPRTERVAEAFGVQIDDAYARLDGALERELRARGW